MPHYKHVVWDWNGTLFDDALLCVEIINEMLIKRNRLPISLNDYQSLFDFPVVNYYRKLGFDFSRESFEDIGTEFIVLYEQRKEKCALQQDAATVLKAIQAHHVGQSILSAYHQEKLNQIIDYFKLKSFFKEIIGLSHHYATSKISLGESLMQNLTLSPRQIVIIGDTTHDFEVAKATGIDCILIFSGHQTKKKLFKCGVPVLDCLGQLPKLIL